jgi:hypothetical protein
MDLVFQDAAREQERQRLFRQKFVAETRLGIARASSGRPIHSPFSPIIGLCSIESATKSYFPIPLSSAFAKVTEPKMPPGP